MKKILLPLAISAGLMGTAATAATLNIVPGSLPPSGANNFSSDLDAFFGVGNYAFGIISSIVTEAGGDETLKYTELAAESGYTNGFRNSDGSKFVEESPNSFLNAFPTGTGDGFSETYSASTVLKDGSLQFYVASGDANAVDAQMGESGFGVFYSTLSSGDTGYRDEWIFAFDDNGAGPDDNHDDYLILVESDFKDTRINEIPVPASALLLGGAIAGLGFARRRKQKKS